MGCFILGRGDDGGAKSWSILPYRALGASKNDERLVAPVAMLIVSMKASGSFSCNYQVLGCTDAKPFYHQ